MSATLSPSTLLWVPLAPLAGSIIAGFFGKTIGRRGAHTVTILGVLISFIVSAMVLKSVAVDGARFNATIYEWMNLGGLKMEIGFLVDGLTAMMMAVVSFVSLMVHIYTIGYMEEDPGYQRFFSYISLFTFSMLMLVMGKSAQFPLHVWLPDSMEGPTPISALIHAATMVTAGIFMVARMSPLFELSDTALSVVMVIGAITALFMGFLGVIQNDIKRVVAYSTLSQLGYMTVALGA